MNNKNIQKENPFIEIVNILENGEMISPITDDIVKGIKPQYYISNFGNVYSTSSGEFKQMSTIDQVTGSNKNGAYQSVKFSCINENNNRIEKNEKVHRLVLKTFYGNPPDESYVVDHIDCNKRNNNLNNLEWVTQQENVDRSIKNNLIDRPLANDINVLINIAKDLEKGYYTEADIAERYNVSKQQVHRIKNGSYKDLIGTSFDFKFKQSLSDNDIINIFDRSRNGESFELLANEYNVTPRTIKTIYYSLDRYDEILKNNNRFVDRTIRLNKEMVFEIYNKLINGTSIEDISNEYKISRTHIIQIKNGSSYYGDWLKEKGVNIQAKESFSDNFLLKVYNDAANGISDKDISKKYNIHPKTAASIRLGLKSYEDFLKRYNLPKIFNQKLEISSYKKPNKFTEEEAINIYKRMKNEGISTRKLAEELHCDKSLLTDIKYCRRGYNYLAYKYKFKPIEDSIFKK